MAVTGVVTPCFHDAASAGLCKHRCRGAARALLYLLLLVMTGLVSPAAVSEEPAYRLEVLADDLRWPVSVAQLPDGRYLIAERAGRLLLIHGGLSRSLEGVPTPLTAGGGGYLDVLVDPAFEVTGAVFLSYATGTRGASTTAVYRARLSDGRLEDGETIMQVFPEHPMPRNFGGRLLYQPGRRLLLTSGDGLETREQAQSLDSELGKVLRIDQYGQAAHESPFQHPGALHIWSYGHRNPRGIAVASDRGQVFLHDQGPRGGDELNLLMPGRNYGWPAVTHGVDFSGALISPFRRMTGMEDPLWVWPRGMQPSGMAWYDGRDFPEWRDSLLVGSLRRPGLHRLRIHRSRVVDEAWLLEDLHTPIVDVRVFGDDQLVVLTHSAAGQLLLVRPQRWR